MIEPQAIEIEYWEVSGSRFGTLHCGKCYEEIKDLPEYLQFGI